MNNRPNPTRRRFSLAAGVATVLGLLAVVAFGAIQPASAAADPVPTIRGAIAGDRWVPSAGGTVTQVVTYENLTPGVLYRMFSVPVAPDGQLLNFGGGELSFTPTEASGSLEYPFVVTDGYAGQTLTVATYLFAPELQNPALAAYDDRADPLQQIIVVGTPSIRGAVTGERWTPQGWVLTETIAYENLTPGVPYQGLAWMRFADGGFDGEMLDTTSFVPTAPVGTADVDVLIPVSYAGRTLVAAAQLYARGGDRDGEMFTYDDLADPDQARVIRGVPKISSALTDRSDGDQVLAITGGPLVDSVSFENLVPGEEYTMTGTLVRPDATATPITGAITFTAAESSGTVEVPFDVPYGYAGETLVSFQRVYAGTDTAVSPVAEDTDLTDPTQTVTVARADATGAAVPSAALPRQLAMSGASISPVLLGGAAAVITVGVTLLVARRRSAA